MSIYKVDRKENIKNFICHLEVVFKSDGSIEFRTDNDIHQSILSEGSQSYPDWKIKYTKGRMTTINILQVVNNEGKREKHGARVKIKDSSKAGNTQATRSMKFVENDDGDISVSFSIYTNQDKKDSKFKEDKKPNKEDLNAAFSFIVNQSEAVYKFVNGEYTHTDMKKYINEYNNKSDEEKKASARKAIIIK